jgi:UTP--glucose-1-phosphate uridylyltransferase
VEKPAPEDAPSNLTVIGRYVLLPDVFAHLARNERGAGGEIQLTDAMALMIGSKPFHGLRCDAKRYDCGSRAGFVEAQIDFALKDTALRDQLTRFLRNTSAEWE